MDVDKITEINERTSQIASTIKLLGSLSWPPATEQPFLDTWTRGRVELPEVVYPKIDYSEQIQELRRLAGSFRAEHPVEVYTRRTIESFIAAAEMVEAAGTPRLQELSVAVFGKPGDPMPGSSLTNVDAARRLIDLANEFERPHMREPEVCVPAEGIKTYLEEMIRERFGEAGPKVVIVDNLAAKAMAGSRYVRLRAGPCYSTYDADQLFVHEVMTHSLTAINGSMQPVLRTMGRGAPRTTATQEGLATFAEVITASIDLSRLKRLALRIVAIDMALSGASFVDVFKFFVENGQDLKDSFWSAARIFRGGYPDKHIVFTKDGVYLDGLIKVHTLFRWALAQNRLGLVHLLFCGRVTIEDLFLLEEAYDEGYVVPPAYVPRWYERIGGLAGVLSFSLLANTVRVSEIEDYFARGAGLG